MTNSLVEITQEMLGLLSNFRRLSRYNLKTHSESFPSFFDSYAFLYPQVLWCKHISTGVMIKEINGARERRLVMYQGKVSAFCPYNRIGTGTTLRTWVLQVQLLLRVLWMKNGHVAQLGWDATDLKSVTLETAWVRSPPCLQKIRVA